MNLNQKEISMAKELLRHRLEIALGVEITPLVDEFLIDALFDLFKKATPHTIADVLSKHGAVITLLMRVPYAYEPRENHEKTTTTG